MGLEQATSRARFCIPERAKVQAYAKEGLAGLMRGLFLAKKSPLIKPASPS